MTNGKPFVKVIFKQILLYTNEIISVLDNFARNSRDTQGKTFDGPRLVHYHFPGTRAF